VPAVIQVCACTDAARLHATAIAANVGRSQEAGLLRDRMLHLTRQRTTSPSQDVPSGALDRKRRPLPVSAPDAYLADLRRNLPYRQTSTAKRTDIRAEPSLRDFIKLISVIGPQSIQMPPRVGTDDPWRFGFVAAQRLPSAPPWRQGSPRRNTALVSTSATGPSRSWCPAGTIREL
jgi:hypothetical protein